MKQRIVSGWNFRRAVYLAAGLFITVPAILEKQWMILLPGVYFAAMGLFGFGCAAGNCQYNGNGPVNKSTAEPEFEEIKNVV